MRARAAMTSGRSCHEPEPETRAAYYLLPGLFHVAEATTITTILGSCIAVCLWDPRRRIGGMNHFLLPRGLGPRGSENRFGETAVPHLIDRMIEAGATLRDLQAKVFGGACASGTVQRPDHLGLKNADIALTLLDAAGVAVVSKDIGGVRGRKLIFHTDNGAAMVKYL